MSQSVNVNFAKCFIIFMAIVILVEGIVYLSMAVWGIIMHNCGWNNSDPVDNPFGFVVNLIYFSRQACGAPTIHVDSINKDYTLQINYAVAEVISNREFIFFIAYAVVSSLWIVFSLFVLVVICGPITKTVTTVCFWPWLLSVLGGSVLDAIATGYHVHDMTRTTSAESTLDYVGVKDNSMVLEYLQPYDIFFVAPSITFICTSSRVVLIWLLNIFGSIFCMSLAKVVSINNSTKMREQQHRLPVDTTIPAQPQRRSPQPNNDEEIREIQQQDTIVLRYQPTAPPPDLVRKDRRSLEPLKLTPESPGTQSLAAIIAPVAPPISRQQSTNNKRVSDLKSQPTAVTPTPSYQSSDSHPEYLDYPNNRPTSALSQPTIRSATPDLSPVSPLNLRYSTVEGHPFQNQLHITQELRGQLPWSYTNIMNDPIAQKRIQSHLQPDDEEFPPIPEPDYTIHPSRKDRPAVGQTQSTNYSRW